jgi:hypothetical protein
MLGTNARRLIKFAALAEEQGAQNLKLRRKAKG